MKILLVHERFAPDFAGGAEVVVLEIARRLLQRGVGVQVVTAGGPGDDHFEGIPVARLPVSRYRFNLAWRDIDRYAGDVDLLQTNNYHACLPSLKVARRRNLPIACFVHGLFGKAWRQMRGPLLGRAFQSFERYIVTRPYDRWIFPSEFALQAGCRIGIPADKSTVISPGVDVAALRSDAPKDDAVLFAGKLDVRKGIFEVIETARRLPHVRFRIAGWGPEEQSIRAANLPNVELLGFLTGQKLIEAYARAKIFFLPSHAETFGVVLAEAMASGCAVVSSVPFGFEGVEVPVGDVDAMTAAIGRLSLDPELCKQLGRRNAELAQQFSWDLALDRLIELYQELLTSRR